MPRLMHISRGVVNCGDTLNIVVDVEGTYWRYFFDEDNLEVSITGGKDVIIDVDTPGLLTVKFKTTVDHVWDEGRVTKEPTATAEGEKTFKCKHCDAKMILSFGASGLLFYPSHRK